MTLSKISILTCLILFSINQIALSQKTLESGTIIMELTEVNSDDKQMAAQLEMLKGSETNFHFSDEKSLVMTSMMGGMMEINKITNKDGSSELFFNAMGNKMLIESTAEEVSKLAEDQKEKVEDVEVTYDKEDTKEILGYNCYKAKIVGGEEMPMTFHMYLTNDLNVSSKLIQGLDAFDLEGFPLEYVIDMGKMSMTYSTQEIKEELDKSVFEIDPAGYTKMTMDEFMEKMGGMGGMGF